MDKKLEKLMGRLMWVVVGLVIGVMVACGSGSQPLPVTIVESNSHIHDSPNLIPLLEMQREYTGLIIATQSGMISREFILAALDSLVLRFAEATGWDSIDLTQVTIQEFENAMWMETFNALIQALGEEE